MKLLLFAGLLTAYMVAGRPLLGNDTRPARYGAVSLVKRGDLDLDEFFQPGEAPPYWVVRGPSGHVVSRFGPGPSVVAAPVFAVALALGGGRVDPVAAIWLAKLVSSLCVAGAATLLFATALRLGASRRSALVVALVYGLCTTALSVVAQALWQHGPAELFLALALYLLARDAVALAGAALGAMVLCRPPDVVFAVAFLVYVAWRKRPQLLGFVLAALPFAAAQLAWNATYLGGPFHFAQALVVSADAGAPTSAWTANPAIALAGLLVSPSRGLFVYSPVFLLALRPRTPLLRTGLAGAAALVVLTSFFYRWWGGWCFGYRLLADLTPVLALALLPAIQRLPRAVAVLAALSFAIHLLGATCYDPFGWDAKPDVDFHTGRLWSLADSQLRYTVENARLRPGP